MLKKYHSLIFMLLVALSIPLITFFTRGLLEKPKGNVLFEKARVIDVTNENLSKDTSLHQYI